MILNYINLFYIMFFVWLSLTLIPLFSSVGGDGGVSVPATPGQPRLRAERPPCTTTRHEAGPHRPDSRQTHGRLPLPSLISLMDRRKLSRVVWNSGITSAPIWLPSNIGVFHYQIWGPLDGPKLSRIVRNKYCWWYHLHTDLIAVQHTFVAVFHYQVSKTL